MSANNNFALSRSALMAGVCIGIAGFGFLAIGGIAGAVTFAFGLLAVVHYRLKLYTGTAGFFAKGEFLNLCAILGMNIVGCSYGTAIAFTTARNSTKNRGITLKCRNP